MATFYVYELRDPETGIPFYVGKGKGDRMTRHERDVRTWTTFKCKQYNPHLFYKIKKILDKGLRVHHSKVFETEDEQIAFDKERELIALYRKAEVSLCNILDGGEGNCGGHNPASEERKKKVGDALRGVPKSVEHKEALRQAKLRNPVRAWAGKTFSEEHKAKLKAAAQKRWANQDTPTEPGDIVPEEIPIHGPNH